MEQHINTKAALAALKEGGRHATGKHSIPQLGLALMELAGEALTFSSTDGRGCGSKASCPAHDGAFRVMLDRKKLEKALASMGAVFALSFDAEANAVTFEGGMKVKIVGDAPEYPEQFSPRELLAIAFDVLYPKELAAIAEATRFCYTKENRPAMCCVALGDGHVAATDTHKLYTYPTDEFGADGGETVTVSEYRDVYGRTEQRETRERAIQPKLVPKQFAAQMAKDKAEEYALGATEMAYRAPGGGLHWCRLVGESFPQWRNVLRPSLDDCEVNTITKELVEAVKKVYPWANSSTKLVRLEGDKASAKDLDLQTSGEASHDGRFDAAIGVNGEFFVHVAGVAGEGAKLYHSAPERSLEFLRGDGARMLLMPVTLTDYTPQY